MLPQKKILSNEISLAVPAIAIEVASDRAIVVESSESDRSAIHSSSPEPEVLAKQRRELARSVKEAMAARVVLLEAKIGAQRAASNIGSVARLEDVESDGGISAAQTETGDKPHAAPPRFFDGADPCRLRERRRLCLRGQG